MTLANPCCMARCTKDGEDSIVFITLFNNSWRFLVSDNWIFNSDMETHKSSPPTFSFDEFMVVFPILKIRLLQRM